MNLEQEKMKVDERHMNRDKVIIDGRLFRTNPAERMFYDVNFPESFLRFEDMGFDGHLLSFCYNTNRKVLQNDIGQGMYLPQHLIRVQLPADYIFLKYKGIEAYDEFNRKSKYFKHNCAFPAQQYLDRRCDVRPVLLLGNAMFEVHCETGTLKMRFGDKCLSLDAFSLDKTRTHSAYSANWDLDRNRITADLGKALQYPDKFVHVTFDSLKILDPVGCALMEGKSPYAYLNGNPDFHINAAETRPVTVSQKQSLGSGDKKQGLNLG